jgi:ABC-2 type transport system permease protein
MGVTMSNLLRSDFYRLFKSKSFYICMAVEACLFILGIVVLYLMQNSDPTMVITDPSSGIDYGMSAVFGSDLIMLIGIVIGIFVTAEFSHGTMKNVVSKGYSKIYIYLSKLITMIAASYIFIAVVILVGTISATIVTGNLGDFSGEYVGWMFKTLGIEMLLYASVTSLFLMLSMVVKNLGGVIAINIIYALMAERLIFTLLQYAVKSKIKFTEFSLLNNISFYAADTATGSDYLRSAIVGLVVLAVTTVLGIWAFTKSDIK